MRAAAARFEIIDTWNSTGLAGSGSNDYRVKDLFVPDAHTIAVFACPLTGTLPTTPTLTVTPGMASEHYNLAVGDLNHDGHDDRASRRRGVRRLGEQRRGSARCDPRPDADPAAAWHDGRVGHVQTPPSPGTPDCEPL